MHLILDEDRNLDFDVLQDLSAVVSAVTGMVRYDAMRALRARHVILDVERDADAATLRERFREGGVSCILLTDLAPHPGTEAVHWSKVEAAVELAVWGEVTSEKEKVIGTFHRAVGRTSEHVPIIEKRQQTGYHVDLMNRAHHWRISGRDMPVALLDRLRPLSRPGLEIKLDGAPPTFRDETAYNRFVLWHFQLKYAPRAQG